MTTTRTRTIVFGVTIDYQLRYHDGLYQRLADMGWDVHLVTGRGPVGARLASHPGVTVHELEMARSPHPGKDLIGLVRWVRLLKSVRPSVLVVGTPKAALLGSMAGRFARIPQRIYELHGLRLESASGAMRTILRWMERITCRAATRVVAVGESLRSRALAEGLTSPDKIAVLGSGSPNGVDDRHFIDARADQGQRERTRASLDIRPDEVVIVFVGRLTADKGIDLLAEALPRVDSALTPHLVVLGSVDDDSGRLGAEHLRTVARRVTFVGEVDDVAPYLAVATVLCLPSRREGLPTVILEAFAAGVAVVATAATGIVDLVENEKSGLLVPLDSPTALAGALTRILSDEELRRTVTQNALGIVQDQYRTPHVQQLWVDLVQDGTS